MIRIVTDSTSDLPKSVIEQYALTVVPAYINFGEQSFTDGGTLSRADFYTQLATSEHHPSTAAPAPEVFAEVYKQLVAEGATHILSIHISAELSAFLTSASTGAKAVDIPVTQIDSRNTTMGLGLLVIKAAEAVAAGESVEVIMAMLKYAIPRTFVYAACDTLKFLRRSGRVGFATAGIGSLLKIKPILVITEGKATSFARVRTEKKVIPKLGELVADKGAIDSIAIVHSAVPERAQQLKAHLKDQFKPENFKLSTLIGPAIGTHVGVGTVGVAFILK